MNLLWIKKRAAVVLVITMAIFGSVAADNFHSILGTAIYIPDEDLLGSIPNGIAIFKNIPPSCLRKLNTATTSKYQSFYKNTAEFYKSIATETNLKANYESSFSLGFTLDVTTKHVSGRKRNVTGTSLNLATKAYELQFLPKCLYETAVQQRVLDDFSELNTEISKPWYKVSWRKYQTFLQTYGSHVITGVSYGSSINQYVFADMTTSYSARDFTVKACASVASGAIGAGIASLGISACSGVSQEEISKLSNSKMTTSITVKGGTDDTRNKLVYKRSTELILKFLNEGQTNPTPIELTLTPIWQILRRQRHVLSANSNANVQAVNLRYYYDGYLNFDCPYIQGVRGPEIQRFDFAQHSTPDNPVYECSLAPPGCHSDDDCHYHVGVWCTCNGDSCIRHGERKLENGAIRKTAAPYRGTDWGWQGCDWKRLWASCYCEKISTKRVVISRL